MSTANKLTYLNDTKQELKQKINNLGGEITDETTFRQYANQLQTIYDNAPKTDYEEGSNITLSNTLKGKLDYENNIVGYGQTSQEGTPTPDNPQDIEVVRGKNRFDGELLPNSYNPTTGEIEASSTSYRSNKIPLQKNETYYLSGITGNVRVLYWNNTSYVSSEVITMPNSFITKGNIIAFQFDKSLSHENIMIEPGSQATSYLPYNTIEVVERGKNLFDYSTNIIENANIDSSNMRIITDNSCKLGYVKCKPNTTYTISRRSPMANRFFYATSESLPTISTTLLSANGIANDTTTSFTFTTPQNANYIIVRFIYNTTQDYETYAKTIQIEEGSTATTYEPYQTPQTYQLSLGEYEFAKIGNYVDTIEYDIDEDKVYKNENIGKKIYTGESSENWSIWQGIILIDDTTIKNLGTSNLNFYLNYFRNVSSIAYIGSNTGQRLHIQLSNAGLSEITSVSAWKTWLSTHNLEFVYVCNETKIPITGTLKDQIKALYYSHSFNGTTIIEIDGQLPLVLKVRALKGE